ncbi:Cytochrome c oxidase assembly protein cox19 [Perkinsus chesapeaki]|uniref:Cytochrome c oxidase assembly protein cox19 n=1 Tax=Perkinsus chesapeaki TaxID=330153 RepID=A0A7J6LTF9_PERCH|nr:Cytochrome c oxidase assembly protein cox19 [Perkinsus chesapeaki]
MIHCDWTVTNGILAHHQKLLRKLAKSEEEKQLLNIAEKELAAAVQQGTRNTLSLSVDESSLEKRIEEIRVEFREYIDAALEKVVDDAKAYWHANADRLPEKLGIEYESASEGLEERITILEEAIASKPTTNVNDHGETNTAEEVQGVPERERDMWRKTRLCMEDLAEAIEENKRDIEGLHTRVEECREVLDILPGIIERNREPDRVMLLESDSSKADALVGGKNAEEEREPKHCATEEDPGERIEIGEVLEGQDASELLGVGIAERFNCQPRSSTCLGIVLTDEAVPNHTMPLGPFREELNSRLSSVEASLCGLARGVARLSQIVGVFPGIKADDLEKDVDVNVLQWRDCANNMAIRVDRTWRLRSQGRVKSLLEAIESKADRSMVRLLQISQEHIDMQLERLEGERNSWKEMVKEMEKRSPSATLSSTRPTSCMRRKQREGSNKTAQEQGPTTPSGQKFRMSRDSATGVTHPKSSFMTIRRYLKCLRTHRNDNRSCRFLAKEYLQCRMDHGLMAPEPMERLGFTSEDDRARKPREFRTDTVREDEGWLAGRDLLEARGWVRPRMFGGGVWGGAKLDNRNKVEEEDSEEVDKKANS